MSDLSVVIVTYNSAGDLPGCAAALGDAVAGRATQVIVVDNASTDDSAMRARQLWPAAQVIANDLNRGFAAAVNQGLELATAPTCILLNPDARPEPGCLAAMADAVAAAPRAGIVAPRLVDGRGPVLSCYPFPTLSSIAWWHLQLFRVLPNRLGGRYRRATLAARSHAPVAVPWAQGACLAIRRALLDEVGHLDEHYVFYGEEVDLTRRAAAAGWQCLYLPGVSVAHEESSSARRVAPLKLISHYVSTLVYFEQHQPRQVRWLKALFVLDLAWRIMARAPGVLVRRPPDAAQRLRAYWTIATVYLPATPAERDRRWRALAAASTPTREDRVPR